MAAIFLMVKFVPFWAVPLALVVGDVGWHLHKRRNRLEYVCYIAALCLISLAGIWLYYRGDVNSDKWLKSLYRLAAL